MKALVQTMHGVLAETGVDGSQIEAIALDTTGSSVVMVDGSMQPLDDYSMWCDHRALREAQEITALAHSWGLEAIQWCGGVYSHEWGWAKLLHWLRHNAAKRSRFGCAGRIPPSTKSHHAQHSFIWFYRHGGIGQRPPMHVRSMIGEH